MHFAHSSLSWYHFYLRSRLMKIALQMQALGYDTCHPRKAGWDFGPLRALAESRLDCSFCIVQEASLHVKSYTWFGAINLRLADVRS